MVSSKRKRSAMQARLSAETKLLTRAIDEGDCLQRRPAIGFSDVRLAPGRARRLKALVQREGESYTGFQTWEPLVNLTVDMQTAAQAKAHSRFPRARHVLDQAHPSLNT